MFGPGPALIAAALTVFEPNLLAHSGLVTTDFGLTCLSLASVYTFWRCAEQPSAGRLVGCGVVTGLVLAAKHSGVLLAPTFIFLAAWEAACQVLKPLPEGALRLPILLRQLRMWTFRLAGIAVGAIVTLWGFYGFRYAARPNGWTLPWKLTDLLHLLNGHFAPFLIATAARFHLLPESYLYGMVDVLVLSRGPRPVYLFGRLYPHSIWYFFPAALLIKSTLGFLGLFGLAIAVIPRWAGEGKRHAAYLLIPPMVFMAAGMTSGLNIGIRHVLPMYPFLILAASAGAWVLASKSRRWQVVVAVLLGAHIASSLRSSPDYLAYSNEFFGGTSRTYRILTDSNVDWGQGLKEASEYLTARHINDCWLAYFGNADPDYNRVPCKLLPDPFTSWWGRRTDVLPEKYHGVVVMSATEMSGISTGPDELNPYGLFLNSRPVANIGGSLLVYEGDFSLPLASALGHMDKAWELYLAHQQNEAIEETVKAMELAPRHRSVSSFV